MGNPDYIGLTTAQAQRALASSGPNALPDAPVESPLKRFLRQFHNPVIYILLFALGFDLIVWWQEGAGSLPLESFTILLILLFNALLGAWQESKSEAALAHLKLLAAPKSWVMRDGKLMQLPSDQLVPEDLVRLEAGERVPADGVLLSANGFSVDESVVTGESLPQDKGKDGNLLSGTLAVRGMAWLKVTATGLQSNMGQLATLLQHVAAEKTPLEKRLERFGRQIALAVVVLAVAVLTAGVLSSGFDGFNRLFLFAVALAVAAVPESLPAVLTLAMALGMERMAKRKAVVRRLAAVEALGSVTVIATDKTGTLTENRMRVESVDVVDETRAHKAMVLVNDADPQTGVGDPLELALLDYVLAQGADDSQIRKTHPRISEKPFDAEWKYMRVTVEEAGPVSYFKGAPEVIMDRCQLEPEQLREWQTRMSAHAANGFRMLALAWCKGEDAAVLNWLGLIMLWDPPRSEVPDAIGQAQLAGVRVVMITGDHPATARAIADRIGIQAAGVLTGDQLDQLSPDQFRQRVQDTGVFARVKPEHKLAIVQSLQEQGEIVAVTGDGVNDAPALKAADVGIAMGGRGSDVSREVADLVLLDDNFATIVSAIEEGRSIFENIQKFIRLLFSANLSEVLLIVVGALLAFSLAGQGSELLLPLTAVQILWVNLLTDSLPALAITTDYNPGVLKMKPRKASAPLMEKPTLLFVLVAGVIGGMIALALYFLLPELERQHSQVSSLVFSFLVFVQLMFVRPARLVTTKARFNRWVAIALLAAAGVQVLAMTNEALRQFLGITTLTLQDLGVLIGALLISWLLAEIVAAYLHAKQRESQS